MTNDEINDIYKAAVAVSRNAALRAVYNAGWYAGAGQTPTAGSEDKSAKVAKPSAVVQVKKV